VKKPIPKDVQDAFDFSERWDQHGIFKKWRDEQMAAFIAWQESEARIDWWMNWVGAPFVVALFIAWAVLTVYWIVTGFPKA